MKTRIRSALSPFPFVLAVTACLGTAHADMPIPWRLADFPVAATDSASAKALYGTSVILPEGFGGQGADQVSLSVSDGTIKLTADFSKLEAPRDDYSANLGLLQPLTADGSVKDMSSMTSISFDVRFSNTGKALKQLKVSLVSDAYSMAELNAGTALMAQSLADGIEAPANKMTISMTSAAWQTVTLTSANFGYSKWNESDPSVTWAQAIAKLKAFQFSPETDYDSSGIGANGGIVTMEIRNIVIKGAEPFPLVKGMGCNPRNGGFVLSAFRLNHGSTKNEQGGQWSAYMDTSSVRHDSAVGASTWLADPTFDSNGAHFAARLEKTVAGAYHPYAGWAGLQTNFHVDDAMGYIALPNLTAISFSLRDVHLDTAAVDGITFKVPLDGVGRGVTHSVLIPTRQALTDSNICVDATMLTQPGWFDGASPFDPSSGVGGFQWEVVMANHKDSSLHSTEGNRFTIDPVILWGISEDCGNCAGCPATLPEPFCAAYPEQAVCKPVGIQARSASSSLLAATYASGELRLSGFEKSTSLEILRLDGRRVAAFAPSPSVKLRLERGTYLLVAKENGAVSTRTLPVLR